MATPPRLKNNSLRASLKEAYKAGLRRALMLTEKHNVAGVRELIYGMVNTSDTEEFRTKAEEFMQAFADHVGAEYERNAFVDAFDEVSYWNLCKKFDLGVENDQFDLEFGLCNTIELLAFYCGGWGDGTSDFINFDHATKTLQGGDGADFLFTANHIAKELRKKYLSVAENLIRCLEWERGEGYVDDETIDEVQGLLKNRIKDVEKIKFNNNGVIGRQQWRKEQELYGTGAKTHKGKKYMMDEFGNKRPRTTADVDRAHRLPRAKNPWNRSARTEFS